MNSEIPNMVTPLLLWQSPKGVVGEVDTFNGDSYILIHARQGPGLCFKFQAQGYNIFGILMSVLCSDVF